MSETDEDWPEYRPAAVDGSAETLAYIAKLERHVGVLQDKVWRETSGNTCACGYDTPDDVCMVHAPNPYPITTEREDP